MTEQIVCTLAVLITLSACSHKSSTVSETPINPKSRGPGVEQQESRLGIRPAYRVAIRPGAPYYSQGCNLLPDGRIGCWGPQAYRNTGAWGLPDGNFPNQVANTKFESIVGGFDFLCGISQGKAICWASRAEGDSIVQPPDFHGAKVLQLFASTKERNRTACAFLDRPTDRLVCWGDNADFINRQVTSQTQARLNQNVVQIQWTMDRGLRKDLTWGTGNLGLILGLEKDGNWRCMGGKEPDDEICEKYLNSEFWNYSVTVSGNRTIIHYPKSNVYYEYGAGYAPVSLEAIPTMRDFAKKEFREIAFDEENLCIVDLQESVQCNEKKLDFPADFSHPRALIVQDHQACVETDGGPFCWLLSESFTKTIVLDRVAESVGFADRGEVIELQSQAGRTCARYANGRIQCWAVQAERRDYYPTPAELSSTRFLKIAVSGSMSCGITENRELKCWGRGQDSPVYPNELMTISKPTQLIMRDFFICVANETKWGCWDSVGKVASFGPAVDGLIQGLAIGSDPLPSYTDKFEPLESRLFCALSDSKSGWNAQCFGSGNYKVEGKGENGHDIQVFSTSEGTKETITHSVQVLNDLGIENVLAIESARPQRPPPQSDAGILALMDGLSLRLDGSKDGVSVYWGSNRLQLPFSLKGTKTISARRVLVPTNSYALSFCVGTSSGPQCYHKGYDPNVLIKRYGMFLRVVDGH